jgi:hypothetical protein
VRAGSEAAVDGQAFLQEIDKNDLMQIHFEI